MPNPITALPDPSPATTAGHSWLPGMRAEINKGAA